MGNRGWFLRTGLAAAGLCVGFISAANAGTPPAEKDDAAVLQTPSDARTPNISRMEICPSIVNKCPQGSAAKFKAEEVARLYCYTEIEGTREPTYVTHTWYYNDKHIVSIKLAVEFPRWRNWSNKTILPVHKGNWKVEVADAGGKVLKSVEFVLE